MKRKVDLMLDSGAFAAWTRKVHIPIEQYIRFIKDNAEAIHSYINLDVIPGAPGQTRTSHQVEEAAAASWKNYQTMRKSKLDPMVVYHIGERRYWLEKMLGEGCSYLGLGGVAMEKDEGRRRWLDEVFEFITCKGGYPPCKVHGLGITSIPIVLRYPFTTTDSTSWVFGSKTGICYIPQFKAGKYVYTETPMPVRFATTARGEKKLNLDSGFHYLLAGAGIKEFIDSYLTELGFTPEDCLADYKVRYRVNIRYFLGLAARHPGNSFKPRHSGLFSSPATGTHGSRTSPGKYRVVFVTGCSNSFQEVMHLEGVRDQLISYYDVMDRKDLKEFVKSGFFKVRGQTHRVRIKAA